MSVTFAQPSYTFNEDDVIGIVEVIISGPVREDAQVIVIGGEQLVINLYKCILLINCGSVDIILLLCSRYTDTIILYFLGHDIVVSITPNCVYFPSGEWNALMCMQSNP